MSLMQKGGELGVVETVGEDPATDLGGEPGVHRREAHGAGLVVKLDVVKPVNIGKEAGK